MGAQKKKDGPLIVKQGSVSVAVYSAQRTKKGRKYSEATAVWYELDGRRCRKTCATLDAAKEEATTVAARLSRGMAVTGVLSAVDLDRYRHAVAQAAIVGTSLQIAMDEYVQARRLVPPGSNFLAIVKEHVRRLPTSTPTVQEVVDEMIAEKRPAKLSKFHIDDLDKRLTPFAEAMQTKISSLSAAVVRPYLEGLRKADEELVAPRTRLNTMRAICGLFHFVRKRKYVTRELVDDVSEIDLPKARGGAIGVFTAAQIRNILESADPDLIPCLAIGAFAGLRSAELSRLKWSDVKLKERVIAVGADAAKTATRRVVPIQDNLAAWLEPHFRSDGSVSPSPNENALWQRFHRGAAVPSGVPWVRNGLRHSFVS